MLSSLLRRPPTRTQSPVGQEGFTLVELLVVLAIIAMLATLIGPKVLGYLGGARSDTARAQVRNIASAVDLYYMSTGSYPTKEQGLEALVIQPDSVPAWKGPYLQNKSALKDPWGRPYVFELTPSGYVVKTFGRSGQPGGTGEDKEISSAD